jgi:hypothetical protein
MPKRQRCRRQDVGRRGGLAFTSQDVEHDIGGMNPVTERFSTGGSHSRESIGQRRVEDVDHLSIAVIDAGKLAPYTLQRRGLRGVKLVISDAREGIRAAVSRFG